jgi:hypothetical protein
MHILIVCINIIYMIDIVAQKLFGKKKQHTEKPKVVNTCGGNTIGLGKGKMLTWGRPQIT